MSNAVLNPMGVAQRYQTHRSKLMTLWVTRQGQEFVTSGDLQFSDVELVNASVELVGEPGIGNVGHVASATTPHRATMNLLHAVNEVGVTSKVNGIEGGNRVLQKVNINHGHLNITIEGMMQGDQFRSDAQQEGNNLQIVVPTDLGLSRNRITTWPVTPLLMEKVELQQQIKVHCHFAGTSPANNRVGRFVEDWADSPQASTVKRNTSGLVRYFVNNDEGQSSSQECQVPSNCIEHVKLVFKVIPRTDL